MCPMESMCKLTVFIKILNIFFLSIIHFINLITHTIVVNRAWKNLVINNAKSGKYINNLANRKYDSKEKGHRSPIHEFKLRSRREMRVD